eukprot:514882-Karenia_brevis.AAC.1
MAGLRKGDQVVFGFKMSMDGRPQASFVKRVVSGCTSGINILYGETRGMQSYDKLLHPNDLVVVPNFLCAELDLTLFNDLHANIQWPRMARLNNSHFCVYNPSSPLYDNTVARISSFFQVVPRNTCRRVDTERQQLAGDFEGKFCSKSMTKLPSSRN